MHCHTSTRSSMQSSKKIFILLRSLDVIGGTEIQTLNLAKVLVANNYQVSLIIYFEVVSDVAQLFEKEGVEVQSLFLDPRQGLWKVFKGIYKFLSKENPDICHIQYMNPGLIPILAARLARVPRIIGHIHQPATYYSKLHRQFVRVADRLCHYFISVSLTTQESWFGQKNLYRLGDKKVKNFTLYNSLYFVYEDTHQRDLDKEIEKTSAIHVGMVGRLRWEKGQAVGVKAFARACRQVDNLFLHIVGIGPDWDTLHHLVEEEGIQDKVKFYGQLSPDELKKIYAFLDVVLVPSRFEAFGLTAIEAMQYGIPVIASGVDGLREVITHGEDGYLTEEGKVADMEKYLVPLCQNDKLRLSLGQKAKIKVKENFSFDKFSDLIVDFYSNL